MHLECGRLELRFADDFPRADRPFSVLPPFVGTERLLELSRQIGHGGRQLAPLHVVGTAGVQDAGLESDTVKFELFGVQAPANLRAKRHGTTRNRLTRRVVGLTPNPNRHRTG